MDKRIVYLGGKFLPIEQAHISVMDRGFLFGDGVYEVIPVYNGHIFRVHQHLDRLQKSLDAIELNMQIDHDDWIHIIQELLKQNPQASQNYNVYLQITRGASSERAHVVENPIKPTIFVQCTKLSPPTIETLSAGYSAITLPDIRWSRCAIKSINLLPNVLFAQQAKNANAKEAILIRNGELTEGATSNVFIVKNAIIKTPPLSELILGGITRDLIIELANQYGLKMQETTITEAELRNADEIWISSSTKEIMPIVQLDNEAVNDGKAGTLWKQIIEIYHSFKKNLYD